MAARKRWLRRAKRDGDIWVETNFFPTPASYAEWLFDFLRQDIDKPGSEVDLRRRAFEFISFGDGAVIDLTPDGGLADDQLPTVAVLKELQHLVIAGIATLRAGRWWSLPPVAYGLARLGSRLTRGSRQGPFRSLFLVAAADAVEESWSRLWECPHCGCIFVKVGKQRYCSATCSQKTRWSRFKDKRRARDYRKERESVIRKRLGAKVKLGHHQSRRSGSSP